MPRRNLVLCRIVAIDSILVIGVCGPSAASVNYNVQLNVQLAISVPTYY